MTEDNIISCVKWIRSGYASELPKEVNYNDIIQNEDQSVPHFAQDDIEEFEEMEDNYPMEIEDSEDEAEEREEILIRNSDWVLMAGRIEDEYSSVEVYVFEPETSNFFVHHDFQLIAFPTCLEWLGMNFFGVEQQQVTKGNFGIVAQMDPSIEIWDLDIKNPVQPMFVLKGNESFVTTMKLHSVRNNILLSGYENGEIAIWDLVKQNQVFNHKLQGIVKSLTWSPFCESVFYGLSEDNKFLYFDLRQNKGIDLQLQGKFENMIESICTENVLVFSNENNHLVKYDISQNKIINVSQQPVHDKDITGLCMSYSNKIISTSLDEKIRVIDYESLNILGTMKPNAGELFGGSLNLDSKDLFACGSSIGEVVLFDITDI